jgi:hypothetical protein
MADGVSSWLPHSAGRCSAASEATVDDGAVAVSSVDLDEHLAARRSNRDRDDQGSFSTSLSTSSSEREADDGLRHIAEKREDPTIAAFRDAPEDNEPVTAADEEALAEVQADRAADVPRISFAG